VSLFPALERTLDLNSRGALTLVTHCQTPAAILRLGRKRLRSICYLRNPGIKGAETLAEKAFAVAKTQSATLATQSVTVRIVAELIRECSASKSLWRPSIRSLSGVSYPSRSPDPR
jgi:hypothetical protein